MTEELRIYDNFDGDLLAADDTRLVPDSQDPEAGLWFRPMTEIQVSEERL